MERSKCIEVLKSIKRGLPRSWVALNHDTDMLKPNKDSAEALSFAIKELEKKEVGVEEIAEVIAIKCKEITAEWWEKDAEVYAQALKDRFVIKER